MDQITVVEIPVEGAISLVEVVEPSGPSVVEVPVEADVAVVEVLIPGIQGATGSASQRFLHVQAIPSAIWTIEHNLNCYPEPVLIDSAGDRFDGDVHYPSKNTLIVSLIAATSGIADMI